MKARKMKINYASFKLFDFFLFQKIILTFRIVDLQNLLGYPTHLDKTKKSVLQERCLNLLKTANIAATADKIKEIQKQL